MNRIDAAVGLDDANTVRFATCQIEVALADSAVKLERFHFETALVFNAAVVAGARPSQADARLDIEEDRELRTVAVADQFRQLFDELQRYAAAKTLVRH